MQGRMIACAPFKFLFLKKVTIMLQDNHSINEQGHFAVAGFDTVTLARKYGTPLYVFDEDLIRRNCRAYVQAMKKHFGGGSKPLLASKALSCKAIYRIAREEGMGTDIVSSGELYTALSAGFPAEDMFFHGSAKTMEDVRFGMDSGVGFFVVDNSEELSRIAQYAREKGLCQKILLRVAPGIDPHTFEAVNTGRVDSKFGAAIETGQALALTELALNTPGVELLGFHCHIGSQIFDCEPFTDAADIMLRLFADVRDALGFEASVLDLGGGMGVRYTEADPVIDYEANIAEIARHIRARCEEYGLALPTVYMEPGRSIVAAAGVTLYTAQSIKTIPGYKTYLAIDGGMTDNPRYALYQSRYSVLIANRASQAADFRCTLAGRCCESGDLIGEDLLLAKPEPGDTVAVLVTGAYNYSMASNYNRVGRPPIVMLHEGRDYLAVRRETFEDLCACDL